MNTDVYFAAPTETGVERNPQPGRYCGLVRTMQQGGREYPQIWHLFAFQPQATDHLASGIPRCRW
jgi:hypothetical protein